MPSPLIFANELGINGVLVFPETSSLSFYILCFGCYFVSWWLILFWSQQFVKIMNDWISFYCSACSNFKNLFINRTYRKDRIVLLYQQVGSRYASIGVVFHCFRKNCGGFSSCTDYNKTVVRIFTITSDPKLETETTRFNIEFGHHCIPILRILNWNGTNTLPNNCRGFPCVQNWNGSITLPILYAGCTIIETEQTR